MHVIVIVSDIFIILRSTAYTIARICHGISVSLSVTRVYCNKTAEHIVEILSLCDRSIILICRHQRLLCKSDGFTPNGGRIQGVAISNQYVAISRKR